MEIYNLSHEDFGLYQAAKGQEQELRRKASAMIIAADRLSDQAKALLIPKTEQYTQLDLDIT